jgi:AraC-like DNA-binding protein
MSTALAVSHGRFGRVTLYVLDRAMATHAHREGHLVFHVRGRHSRVRVGDDECEVCEGLAAAVNPWQPHSFHPGDVANGTLFLVLYIKPVWFLEASRSAKSPLRFGRSRIEVTERIDRLVHLVSSLLLQNTHEPMFLGYLHELTHECFDQSWQWFPEGALAAHSRATVRDFRVRNSLRLMRERISEEWVLDQIARDSGLSRPHFYKLFRQQVGLTPNLYRNTLRMESAIQRLVTTAEPVTAIGLDLGFSSQASFTRFFVSNVGIAPSDYRRVAHVALEAGHPAFSSEISRL